MTAVTELELPTLAYMDAELRGPRYRAAMAALRGHDGWLAAGPLGYVVTGREAGELFLRTKAAVFPGLAIADMFDVRDGPLHEEIVGNIINVNGDDHRRLRNLLNPALSPRAADGHRPAMRGLISELLDGLGGERCDFVTAVAKPYPALVIAHLLGAPPGDASRLHEWSNSIQRQFDAASLVTERAAIERSVEECYAWARELLAARRAPAGHAEAPAGGGDGLVAALLAAEDEGDRLSEDEVVNLVVDVMLGGIDTAQSQLAHAVRLLAEHPDQWERLRADPSLAGAAVDESLRFEPVTPFTARITIAEIEHRGVTFPPGSVVMVSAWHANRDDPALAEPDRFDIARGEGAGRLLTFGAGIHYCVGANIARAELSEALAVLAERVERIELDGEPEYGTITGIYGLDRLPVRLAGVGGQPRSRGTGARARPARRGGR
jgi:cytochrome P450